MNDKYGTIIYLIILLIIFIAGAFRKKGKSGEKTAGKARNAESVLEKLMNSAAGIPDISPRSGKETGSDLRKVERKEIRYEKNAGPVEEAPVHEKEKEFLPRDQEGVSVFSQSQVQHDMAYSLDDDHMKQHDWNRGEGERETTSLREDIMTGFDLRKAVIYSEILTHKYF